MDIHMSSLSAKEYFRHFLADDKIRQLNRDLVNEILKYKPTSVFEFGCGQGKNLELLLHMRPKTLKEYNVAGIDVSRIAINEGGKKGNRRRYIMWGDENTLAEVDTDVCDVSFTCSVLDHIEHEETVAAIIANLKRMSRKAVILFETQRHTPETFYYRHPYEGENYGFTKLKGYQYLSSESDGGDGSLYEMFVWKRRRNRHR